MNDDEQVCSPVAEAAGEWCRIISERSLTAEESAAFDAWMHADPDHRMAFERASFIWRAFDGQAAPPELVAMRMDALSALAGQDDAPVPAWWQRKSVRRSGLAALAASILLVFGLAFFQPPTSNALQYATALGERRVVMLGDGSRLSMDAASEVSVAYSNDRRDLVLKSGRAKFDVAKDPLKPFTVAAGDKLIVATGTSFSVEILNGEVNVVLFEGHVAVLDRKSRRPAFVPSSGGVETADGILKPGQALSLAAGGTAKLEDVDLGLARSWEAGQLSFADEPLAEAVERMNRYSRTKFVVGDAKAGAVAISGVFNSDDVEGFVADLAVVFPVRAVRRDGDIVFVSR